MHRPLEDRKNLMNKRFHQRNNTCVSDNGEHPNQAWYHWRVCATSSWIMQPKGFNATFWGINPFANDEWDTFFQVQQGAFFDCTGLCVVFVKLICPKWQGRNHLEFEKSQVKPCVSRPVTHPPSLFLTYYSRTYLSDVLAFPLCPLLSPCPSSPDSCSFYLISLIHCAHSKSPTESQAQGPWSCYSIEGWGKECT